MCSFSRLFYNRRIFRKIAPPILACATPSVTADFGTAYLAVRSNLLCFEFIDEKFKDYDKFMYKCISFCPEAFKFASYRLKKDKIFVLKAISNATWGT